jgi:hypothetical protein
LSRHATLRGTDGQIRAFNGVVYVQVRDLPESCAKAKKLAGTIPHGFPFNLPDGTGAIALLADPAGHPIGMYSRRSCRRRRSREGSAGRWEGTPVPSGRV